MVAKPFWWRMPHMRLVDRVENDVADARVAEQHPLLAGIDVDFDDVAEGVIVLGIIGFARVRVEGQAVTL